MELRFKNVLCAKKFSWQYLENRLAYGMVYCVNVYWDDVFVWLNVVANVIWCCKTYVHVDNTHISNNVFKCNPKVIILSCLAILLTISLIIEITVANVRTKLIIISTR